MVDWCVTVIGIYATVYTGVNAIQLCSKRLPLWTAMGISEASQSYLAGIVVLFSLLESLNVLVHTPEIVKQLMRVTMFGIVIWTTRRLRRSEKPISKALDKIRL